MQTGGTSAPLPAKPGAAAPADLRAVLEALDRIERRLDRIEGTANGAMVEAKHAVAMVTDTADRWIGRMQADGIDLDARLANLLRAAERLSSAEAVETLDATFSHLKSIRAVLDSGVFDRESVRVVALAGRALADAAAEEGEGVGAFGLLRSIGEDDVRNATGLLVRFARRLGRALGRDGSRALSDDNGGGDR
ncbi:MAG: DUF1641 domain-containing protein [Sandaracinaceae bacterium]